MTPNTDRIYWIDTLRALAIILMVFGHTCHVEAEVRSIVVYIYSFHMPLFFFISGLNFYPEKYSGSKAFITKKISSLLIPYFFFSFLGYGLLLTTEFRSFSLANFFNALFRILYADTDLLDFGYDGPLWFLPCLFLVEIGFYFISFLKKGTQTGVIGLLVVLGFILAPLFKYIPWTAAGSLVTLLFYWAGFCFREKLVGLKNPFKMILFILGIIISAVFSFLNGPVDIAMTYYGNPAYFLLSALGGITYVVLLTTYTKPNKLLSFIGINSLIIFGLHGAVLFFAFPRLKALINLQTLYSIIPLTRVPWLNPIINIFDALFISLVLTLAQIGFIALFIPLFNKKLYFLLGRKKPH
jgi:acyltransferase